MYVAERYVKACKVSSTYRIIQMGISIFHEDKSRPKTEHGQVNYIAYPFTVFVFPAGLETLGGAPIRMTMVCVHFNFVISHHVRPIHTAPPRSSIDAPVCVFTQVFVLPMSCAQEADAIAFNARHGMDFNKWIKHGVSYSNATEDSFILSRLGLGLSIIGSDLFFVVLLQSLFGSASCFVAFTHFSLASFTSQIAFMHSVPFHIGPMHTCV